MPRCAERSHAAEHRKRQVPRLAHLANQVEIVAAPLAVPVDGVHNEFARAERITIRSSISTDRTPPP